MATLTLKNPGFGGTDSQTGLRKNGSTRRRGGSQTVPWITERCQPLTNWLYLDMGWVQRVQGCFLWLGEVGLTPLCDGKGMSYTCSW